MSPSEKIGDMLVRKGLITPEQLQTALDEQSKSHAFLGEILVKHGFVRDTQLLAALSEQLALPVEELTDAYIDWALVSKFSASLVLDYRCFPVKSDGRSVTIAITNPFDVWVVKRAEEEAHPLSLNLSLCTKAGMDEAVARYRTYMKTTL